MDGILLLNKPAGYTSMDCCAVIRRLSGEQKVGHTGTLDPDATGVLPICIGKATRLIEYMEHAPKRYLCRCILGIETDTYDTSGERTGGCRPDGGSAVLWPEESAVRSALEPFSGEILQMPPKYSAVRIRGKRLYEYARRNQEVVIQPRKVTIHELAVHAYDRKEGVLEFEVLCSRGTFIRSICHDLGEALGTGAAMAALVRTECSGFAIDRCTLLDKVREDGAQRYLLPMATAVASMPKLILGREAADYFGIGDIRWAEHVSPEALALSGLQAVFCEGKLLGTIRDGKIEKVVDEYH